MKRLQKHYQSGFTIIELLIATTVFTLVLILLTTGTLAVTRLYTKGIISSQTQTAARNVVDTITQALQFSGASFSSTAVNGSGLGGFCIGGNQFTYQLGRAVEDTGAHALLERDLGTSTTCSKAPLNNMSAPSTSPPSTELLSDHMQLNDLYVAPVSPGSTLYCISIRIIYGDDNSLLTSPPTPPLPTDSCGNAYQQRSCDDTLDTVVGGEFCAVSGLDTYAQERVVSNKVQ
jgi:prepilin-type N-terminal cleavage/methylation domain-containing protein